MRKHLSSIAVLFALVGCQGANQTTDPSQSINNNNVVEAKTGREDKTIGDEKNQFRILGAEAYWAEFTGQHQTDLNGSLVLGYPMDLLGQGIVFGGVITKVSDTKSDDLGNLKLSDLSPIHGQLRLQADSNGQKVVLYGCEEKCQETSPQLALLEIPVLSVDTTKRLVLMDVAALGKKLNLLNELDPFGTYTRGLTTIDNKATFFDFSLSTLVFDVETHMIPKNSKPGSNPPVTVITSRWYIKLGSLFNPAFTPRDPLKEVGFFTTGRAAKAKITRFPMTPLNGKPAVHYYIKNVPPEFRAHFQTALDSWNENIRAIIGVDLLSYEFIDASDPKAALLVAGDIRYNIIEWDLINKAGYGGLGPSIAHQYTGETFSANVLVQGPEIINIYKNWFKVTEQTNALKTQGRFEEADSVLRAFHKSLEERHQTLEKTRWALHLNEKLSFRIVAQLPEYSDPLARAKDFFEPPPGLSFEQYMKGYFEELVAHEMGHNIGLRHNFRGNLGSTDKPAEGQVSLSIMEYLGRSYRHLNRIADYDRMAISYGYKGLTPTHKNWFCTDEDVASPNSKVRSAECSRDDNTNDPVGYFEMVFDRAIGFLLGVNSVTAPEWKVSDMETPLSAALEGLMLYADSAEYTGKGWTNFLKDPNRPSDLKQVKWWMMDRIKARLCDPQFELIINGKGTPAAKKAAQKNVEDLRQFADEIKDSFAGLSNLSLSCQ